MADLHAIRDFDAMLDNWIVVHWPDYDAYVVAGTVECDTRGRFVDGRMIHTSMVLTDLEDIKEGAIIRTLNTRYLLLNRANVQ